MTPLALIILDGWGLRSDKTDNGIEQANKPNFDRYWDSYPHTAIDASGPAVGLPAGIMGNSEVGHMNLGAGRIVFTGLSQVYQAIEDGSFFTNPALLKAVTLAKQNNTALHLMGLLSDGAVHSHQDHLYALLELAKKEGLQKVFVHCFMDGRDTPPSDGVHYIEALEKKMAEIGIGKIASVSGRFYAMDRDKRWDRVQQACDVLVGKTSGGIATATELIKKSYTAEITDEFVKPTSILSATGNPLGPLQDGDAVIFFNFRADRAREISRALTQSDFKDFDKTGYPQLGAYVCMAPYDESLHLPVAFEPKLPKRVLGEILSENGLRQLRIAETEKYAHVTYFFSGGREEVFKGEERVLVPSPREVATYDLKPEMSAPKVADELCARIEKGSVDVVIANFANTDMVGHTANPRAIVKAVETVDACLGKVVELVLSKNGVAVITADHGNAEQMKDAQGNPHTAHTTNLVPFIVVSEKFKTATLQVSGGRLCDVAPTLLEILQIQKPSEMTGSSLLKS